MTDRLYRCAGIRVQVRSTDTALGERAARLLGRFALPAEDPNTSELRYNLVAGPRPKRRGQRSKHYLYRESSEAKHTTSVAELMNTFAKDLLAVVPYFWTNLYALGIGVVTHGDKAVLLLGDESAQTRRLVAAFCARGYTYASSTLLFVNPADHSWSACPLPLACPDAAAAAELRAAGLAVPDGGQNTDAPHDEDFPIYLDLAPPALTTLDGGAVQEGERAWPAHAVRALVVETATGAGDAGTIAPLSRGRALLRVLQQSRTFNGSRAPQRPPLVGDLLAHAACFTLNKPADAARQAAADDLAAATVLQSLT